MRPVRREENYVEAVSRKAGQPRGLPEDALAPVPEDGVAKPLCRDEGDPTRAAFVETHHSNPQK